MINFSNPFKLGGKPKSKYQLQESFLIVIHPGQSERKGLMLASERRHFNFRVVEPFTINPFALKKALVDTQPTTA